MPTADLGPYRLEELLGRGGMGAVYAAHDERLGRRVAIKHVPPETDADPRRRERLRREAKTLARLNHPAIVQVFDILDTADGDWIVMELVEGPTVAELVAAGPLPLRRALAIGRRVAEGLAEAHAQGVLHRDLKTENVMLNRAGHAKILDFGLAKALWGEGGESSLSVNGQVLGTHRAMSPEQARGLPLEASSDLFALGVLLYELTTAEPPFRGATPLDTLTQITGRPHVPARSRNGAIPARLSELIDRLLEKSPELRPASAAAVAAALAELEADVPGDARAARQLDEAATRDDEPTLDLEASPSWPRRGAAAAERPGSGAGSGSYGPFAWNRRGRTALLALLLVVALVAALGRKTWQSWLITAVATGETVPDNHALFRQGMAYLERFDKAGYPERAIGAFEAVLARDESSAPAHAGLALAYLRQYVAAGDPLRLEQALAVAERAVRLDDHLALARVVLGNVYAELGRFEEARRELEAALTFEPGNAEAYRGLGRVHQGQGRLDEAIGAYEKAVELEPDDRFFRDELGELYYRTGRYERAEAEFSKSIELAPDGIYGYRNLSAVYYAQGRSTEAAEVLQRALEIRPEHSLYSNLGTILFAQGLYQPAARAFERALEHGGANFYLYWANLADAYRHAKDQAPRAGEAYRRAIELLRIQLRAQPGNTVLRARLALYQSKLGDRRQALAELRELGEPRELQAADRYRIAVAYEVCGERDSALAALAGALRAGFSADEVGGDPELFDLRADARYHRLVARDAP